VLGTTVTKHRKIVVLLSKTKQVHICVITMLLYTVVVRIVPRNFRSVPSLYTTWSAWRIERM